MATQARSIARRPKGWGLRIQWLRHVVEVGFLGFIAYLMAQHILTPENSGAGVASPEAYCPFGGFESLYKFISTGGQYVPHTHASNMILFVGVLLSALFAKSYFCGWICPFGTIQDGITAFSRWLQRRIPPVGRGVRAIKRRAAPLAFLDRWLRYLKYGLLVWIVVGTAAYGVMVFREIDPWAALLTIAELELGGGLAVLAVVVVASFFVERPWCRYACPLGATIGLVGKLSPIKIERSAPACTGCGLCGKQCPMGIPVDRVTRVDAVECNMCLQCVGGCPRSGALELKLALPGVKAGRRPAPQVAPRLVMPDLSTNRENEERPVVGAGKGAQE